MTIRTLSMSTQPTKIRTVCFAIFSKHSRFSLITDDEVQRYTALLNFRPQTRLGWLTPYEIVFCDPADRSKSRARVFQFFCDICLNFLQISLRLRRQVQHIHVQF